MKLIHFILFSLVISSFAGAQCGVCEHPVQLIQNGNFSSGNTGFTTILVPGSGFFCPLCPEGTYAVGSNAIFYHSSFTGNDHTNPPNGNFFIANGAGFPNYQVWCQTVNLQANTDYTFSMWARDVTNNANPHPLAQLQVTFNGVVSSPTLVAQGGWSQMQFVWNSGNLNSVQICIINLQDQTGGNDFGLDDISMTSCHEYSITFPASAGPDKTICSGATATLGMNPHPGYSYHWNNSDGLSSVSVANPSVTLENTLEGIHTESYVLTVDSANVGCISTDTVQVSVIPIPSLDLGPDIALCPGESAWLNAGSNWEHVSWQSSASGWISQEPLIIINTPATYTATVEFNNCQAQDAVFVEAVDLPSIDLGPDYAMCSGESTVLTTPVSGIWSTGSTGNQIVVSGGGDYSFTYSSQGCTTSDTVTVNEFNFPVVVLSGNDTICEGNTEILSSTLSGIWNTGETGPSIEIDSSGHYNIVVSNGPCTTTKGIDVIVVSLPYTNLGSDTLVCEGNPVFMNAFGEQNDHYLWSTGDTLQTIAVHSAGQYSVTVSNSCGEYTSHKIVETNQCGWDIFIPNCVTPNADGINDSWGVRGFNISELSIFVYNRLGNLIFSSNTSNEAWAPGESVGDDAYNFLITGTDYDGNNFERRGHVMVLR